MLYVKEEEDFYKASFIPRALTNLYIEIISLFPLEQPTPGWNATVD